MNYVIGIDAGTTCFKARLYDGQLKAIASGMQEYQLEYTPEGYVEVSPDLYWTILCSLIRHLLEESRVDPRDIASLAISSQGETLICVGTDGRPLRKAIVWTDARAAGQAEWLKKDFPDSVLFEVTGQREISPCWPASKIAWLREREPDVFAGTSRFLLLEDYLIYRLTGLFATDYSISSSTIYLDIRNRVWWPEMLAAIGISEDRLPRLYESGEQVGPVWDCAARDLGLTGRTIVCTGAMDQAAGMLGAGNVRSGMLTETTGTCLAVCANIGHLFPAHHQGALPVHYGVLPGSYYVIYWSAAAGSIYRWLRDVFYADTDRRSLYARMDQEASSVPPGCEGLLLLPYLSGMQYPVVRESAAGEFSGIRLFHTRKHFTRAALESVAFLLKQSIDEIGRYGVTPDCIYTLGGGAQSDVWNQIKADVTGLRIRKVTEQEAACKGAAILAAAGAGIIADILDARTAPATEDAYVPSPAPEYDVPYGSFLEKCSRVAALE